MTLSLRRNGGEQLFAFSLTFRTQMGLFEAQRRRDESGADRQHEETGCTANSHTGDADLVFPDKKGAFFTSE